MSVSKVNQAISAWRIFYVHILEKNWEDCRIQRPRTSKKLPSVLSQQSLELIGFPQKLKALGNITCAICDRYALSLRLVIHLWWVSRSLS